MRLRTGQDEHGNDVQPGTTGGLTDLFVHLSQLEHFSENFPGLPARGYEGADEGFKIFMKGLLDTYPHLTQAIKDDIMAYWDNPCQETVNPIKRHAEQEVQRIWEILGMC